MTTSFILIRNESRDKNYVFRGNGMLTRGFYEDIIVQIINEYPVQDYFKMLNRLRDEFTLMENIHPAYMFDWAEKMIFLKYEDQTGGTKDELVIVKPIYFE